MSVVVWLHLLGNELHRQVGISIVVTSACLYGVMVVHWPRMSDIVPRVGLEPTHFHFHHTHNSHIRMATDMWLCIRIVTL